MRVFILDLLNMKFLWYKNTKNFYKRSQIVRFCKNCDF